MKRQNKISESRVRKNPNGCNNVMQVAIKLAEEILEPIGFVRGESDDSFTIWRFENNRDFNFSIKTNFEIDNSFPTYERYQLVYEWIENGECNEQEVWVGGNIDELRNDFLDMANLIAADVDTKTELSDGDYQMGQITESKKLKETEDESQEDDFYDEILEVNKKYAKYDWELEHVVTRAVGRIEEEIAEYFESDGIEYVRVLELGDGRYFCHFVINGKDETGFCKKGWLTWTTNGNRKIRLRKPFAESKKLKEHRDKPQREEADVDATKWSDDFDSVLGEVSDIFGDLAEFKNEFTDNHKKGVWAVKDVPNVYVVVNSYGYDGNVEQMWVIHTEKPEDISNHKVFGDEFGRFCSDDYECLAVYQQDNLSGGGFNYQEFLSDVEDIIRNNFWVDEIGWSKEKSESKKLKEMRTGRTFHFVVNTGNGDWVPLTSEGKPVTKDSKDGLYDFDNYAQDILYGRIEKFKDSKERFDLDGLIDLVTRHNWELGVWIGNDKQKLFGKVNLKDKSLRTYENVLYKLEKGKVFKIEKGKKTLIKKAA